MLTLRTASAEDVASALGITVQSLKRKHRRLHQDTGFPMPLPGSAWQWSRRAVEDWIDVCGKPATPPAPPAEEGTSEDGTADDGRVTELVHRQRQALRERYAGRA